MLDDGDRVTVNKRPHVDEFMRALQAPEFEAHVFTAALDSYAAPVLDRLEKAEGSKLFKRRMYRDSCTPTGMGTFAKDLDTLYPDLSRVVLVDNNPISLMKQPSNGILVPSFFDDPSDDVLPTVLDFTDGTRTIIAMGSTPAVPGPAAAAALAGLGLVARRRRR